MVTFVPSPTLFRSPLAVQFGAAAPLVGADLDARHVLEAQRNAAIGLEHDALDIRDAPEIAAAAHHELELAELDGTSPRIPVAGAERFAQLSERDPLRPQPLWIDHDRVLLHEDADAGDFGSALGP